MNLSEAIRLGALVTEQAFGEFVQVVPARFAYADPTPEARRLGRTVMVQPQRIRACAVGGAYLAVGDPMSNGAQPWTDGPFPILAMEIDGPCPAITPSYRICDLLLSATVCAFVTHLNDIHRWPRERIADWVETVERAQVSAATEPVFAEAEA